MYRRYNTGSGGLPFIDPKEPKRKKGCFSFIWKGCLLLVSIALFSLFVFGGFFVTEVIPRILAGRPSNIPPALGLAVDYLNEREGPLPDDVVLTPELESLGERKGFDSHFGRQYQVQACIAAAVRTGIKRQHLCAVMEMEGGWPSDIEAESYVDGVIRGASLLELGYNPFIPLVLWGDIEKEICDGEECTLVQVRGCLSETCEAILAFLGGNEDLMELFLDRADEWSIANSASIKPLPSKHLWAWVVPLTVKYNTLLNVGYWRTYEIDGISVVVFGTNAPPNHLPDIPDGTFRCPDQVCYVSGHRFKVSVWGTPFLQHTGLDLAGGDGWVRASHNGRVTYSAYLDQKSAFAAQIWSSGNQVIIKSEFPDGTPFCTGYGHGANLLAKVGQEVRAGDVLFLMGDTGLADGIHVHFYIKIGGSGDYCSGGYFIDPAPILP